MSFINKESFEIDHEFVVLRLTNGKTAQDVINDAKKKGDKGEDDWIHYADSGDPLPTNYGTTVTMDLAPGTYALRAAEPELRRLVTDRSFDIPLSAVHLEDRCHECVADLTVAGGRVGERHDDVAAVRQVELDR